MTSDRRTLVAILLASFAACLLAAHITRATAQDAGADRVAALYDAGPVAAPTAPAAVAPPAAPAPADPVAHPGDAFDGFRLWLKTGWPMAVLFAIGSVLIALGARVKRLQTGKAAIAIATVTAAIVAFLGAKAGGMSGAQAMSGTLSVLLGGVLWYMKPNQATLDLSKATPEQIETALLAANKPPAFPAGPPAGGAL